ncbi:MAG: hypothetical protein WAW06_09665 [bacterium]
MKCSVAVGLLVALCLLPSCSADKGTGPGKVNHAPVIAEVRDTTAIAGYVLCIPLETSDEDGDSLQFRLYIVCSWSEIELGRCPIAEVRSSSEEFWFWPRGFDIPTREFMIVVSDSAGASDSTDFTVAVRGMQSPNEGLTSGVGLPVGSGEASAQAGAVRLTREHGPAEPWLVPVPVPWGAGDFREIGVGPPCP